MPPKRSVFRAPGAQHFQLVHRSQRDPLINDPEASQRVLKPVGRGNDRKTAFTLSELESSVDKDAMRENEGEAANYGITYDDSSYDYMQHLRPVGQGGADVVLIPGPKGSAVAAGMKNKGKGKARAEDLFDLPESVLPSKDEVSVQEAWAREESIPRELQGFQPDMDPHLRQVLEALEDDAFVDDEGEWFDELVHDGERRDHDDADWEFKEYGEEPSPQPDREETWEDRFKAFKQSQQAPSAPSGWGEDELSEMADTVGSLTSNLKDMMVVGGKKRRGKRGPSDASGMSMSSSSMFRTQGLRDLDDRFDKIERDYDLDEEEEYWSDDVSVAASQMSSMSTMSKASLFSSASAAPPEVSREDFESIMDDFLENYEVVGRKYRPALGGTGLTGPEKLSVLRSAIEGEDEDREENRRRVLEVERTTRGKEKIQRERVKREEDEGDKWDVETILTTYTNTENHPGMIRSRSAAQTKARAEARARAEAEAEAKAAAAAAAAAAAESDSSDSGSETERETPRVTVARPKGEAAEERRARKAAVKAERSARRAEKKSHKETFGDERRRQLKTQAKSVGGGKAADLTVGSRGVVSLS